MNWYKTLKFSQINGEYWITESGQVMIADGDIGDYNHELYVIETVQSQLSDGNDNYEGWKHETALEILEEAKQELEDQKMELEDDASVKSIDDKLYKIWEMSRNIDYHAYELIYNHLEELGIDKKTFDIAEGHGDAREYAMKRWGWKRLEGNNVETWTLTKNDLKTIGDGLYDAYYEDVETANFNIYVYGNKKWYNNIPWSVIENSNMSSIREYDSLHSISRMASSKFADAMTFDEMPDQNQAYNIFRNSYEKATGKSWDEEKFKNKAKKWQFYGDENGYVAVKPQISGDPKLTGMAGNPRSILKGFKELESLGSPLWGMGSGKIADIMSKKGFFALRGPGAGEIINNLSSVILPNTVLTKIRKIEPDGSIIIEYEDLGKVKKYFMANKAYFDKLLSNENMPEIAKNLLRNFYELV